MWDDFLERRVGVRVTREDASAFLLECDRLGIRWENRLKATDFDPFCAPFTPGTEEAFLYVAHSGRMLRSSARAGLEYFSVSEFLEPQVCESVSQPGLFKLLEV